MKIRPNVNIKSEICGENLPKRNEIHGMIFSISYNRDLIFTSMPQKGDDFYNLYCKASMHGFCT